MNDLTEKHEPLPYCDCHSCAIAERIRLQYETSMLMAATSDLLRHFTKTPSTLKDTEARCSAHKAIQRMDKVLRESFCRAGS